MSPRARFNAGIQIHNHRGAHVTPAEHAKMRAPHGEGWKMLYRWLRVALVNKRALAE